MDLLVEALKAFEGTTIFASHDRTPSAVSGRA